jgi:hypothetical protein
MHVPPSAIRTPPENRSKSAAFDDPHETVIAARIISDWTATNLSGLPRLLLERPARSAGLRELSWRRQTP